MEVSSINLDNFYKSLKGIVKPPLASVLEIDEDRWLLKPFTEIFYLSAKLLGWSFKGEVPKNVNKAVVVLAPHTSVFDLVLGLAAYKHFDEIEGHYIAKKELFDSWLGFFYKGTGGIPIDRKNTTGFVDQVVDYFNSKNQLFLAIAPEGTRKKTKKWKSGFYRIALAANVPIILAYFDYEKKEVGFGDTIYPSGDYKKDAEKIENYYKNVSPLWIKNWSWKIFG